MWKSGNKEIFVVDSVLKLKGKEKEEEIKRCINKKEVYYHGHIKIGIFTPRASSNGEMIDTSTNSIAQTG